MCMYMFRSLCFFLNLSSIFWLSLGMYGLILLNSYIPSFFIYGFFSPLGGGGRGGGGGGDFRGTLCYH